MHTDPAPLREALREAVEELTAIQIEAHVLGIPTTDEDWLARFGNALSRVAALIEQIPAEVRVNDAE